MLKKIHTSKGDYWMKQRFSSIAPLYKMRTSLNFVMGATQMVHFSFRFSSWWHAHFLTIFMLGILSCVLYLSPVGWFQNRLFRFWKKKSGIPSECQTDLSPIRPDVLLGLVWVQNCLQRISADGASRWIGWNGTAGRLLIGLAIVFFLACFDAHLYM